MRTDVVILMVVLLIAGALLFHFGRRSEVEPLRPGLQGETNVTRPVRRADDGSRETPTEPEDAATTAEAPGDPPVGASGEPAPRSDRNARTHIEGRVLDRVGRPVPGARLDLVGLQVDPRPFGEKPPPDQRPRLETVADAEGRFAFEDLEHRTRVLIDARAPDREAWGQVETWAGSVVTIRLFAGAVVEGVVRDPGGIALEGLRITSVQTEAEEKLGADDFFNGALVARSDESGRFHLRGLPPGTMRLDCESGDWWFEGREIEIEGRERLQVELTARPTLSITGRVLRGGAPLRLAELMAVPESGGWREGLRGGTAQTDDEGRFAIRGLRPGRFTLTIQNGLGPLQGLDRARRGEALPEAGPRPFKLKGVEAGTSDLLIEL